MKCEQAVILAAGMGSRLGPITADVPKCLVQVAGASILSRQLDGLARAGISQVVVVTGYLSDALEAALASSTAPLDIVSVFAPEFAATNNIVSLWRAREAVRAPFLLLESDLILSAPIYRAMATADRMALCPCADDVAGSTAVVGRGGLVERVIVSGNRPRGAALCKTINATSLSARSWEVLERRLAEAMDGERTGIFYELVIAEAIADGELELSAQVFADEAWIEIDTPADLARANRQLTVDDLRYSSGKATRT